MRTALDRSPLAPKALPDGSLAGVILTSRRSLGVRENSFDPSLPCGSWRSEVWFVGWCRRAGELSECGP